MVEDTVEFAFADGVEHKTVLLAELLFLLSVPELSFLSLAGVGSGLLADAAPAHENLGLQNEFAFTCLALHVIDRVAMLHVGIKAENHRGFSGSVIVQLTSLNIRIVFASEMFAREAYPIAE